MKEGAPPLTVGKLLERLGISRKDQESLETSGQEVANKWQEEISRLVAGKLEPTLRSPFHLMAEWASHPAMLTSVFKMRLAASNIGDRPPVFK